MKVLQFVNNISNGGIAQYQKLLITSLSEKLCFEIVTRSTEGKVNSFFIDNEIPIKNIKIYGIKDFKSLKILNSYITASSTNLIHTHSVQTMIYSVILKPFSKKPVIWSDLHSYSFKDFGWKLYISAKLCSNFCDEILVGTDDRKKLMVKELRINERKIKVINAGVDTRRFNYTNVDGEYLVTKFPKIKNKIVITLVGRLSNEKGHKYLVEAADILKSKGYSNLVYLFVGEGPLKEPLKNYIKEKKLHDDFFFLGQSKEIPEILKGTNILVLPALYDNMAYAILEALSMRVPVIASDVGGVSEVIKNKETGFLVEPKDSKAIARKIEILLNDEKLVKEIGLNGELIVRENFSLEKHANDIMKIYSKYI